VDPVEGKSGVHLPRGDLHPQQPVELPAALLEQPRLHPRVSATPPQQLDGGEQLPDRHRAARHVLAVIARVVPAAGDVEASGARPSGIQALGIGAGPGARLQVAEVASGSPVTRGASLVDRDSGALQVEEGKRVAHEGAVQPVGDREPMAARAAGLDDEAMARRSQAREVQHVRGQPRRGLRLHRPRSRLPSGGDGAVGCAHDELRRLAGIRRPHRSLRSGREVAELVDPYRRPAH
jgi:hypothetical protein